MALGASFLTSSLLEKLRGETRFSFADVGSMGGLEAEWQDIEHHPRFESIGFEPDPREYEKLQTTANQRYFPFALYSKAVDGLQFHVCRDGGKSSLLEPNRSVLDRFPNAERFDVISHFPLSLDRMTTLDKLAADHSLQPDFLKLDTQGTEHMIMQGAKAALDHSLLGAKIEVEFIEMYKGQPLFRDVDASMADHTFELVDLRRVYWKFKDAPSYAGKGQLAFGDALYMRPIDWLVQGVVDGDQAWNRCLKAMLVAWQYRLPDRAVVINTTFQAHFPAIRHDLSLLLTAALATLTAPLFPFKGRLRLSRWLTELGQRTTVSDQGYSDADSLLGNRSLY